MWLLTLLNITLAADCRPVAQDTQRCTDQCTTGDAEACRTWGYLLETGLGVPQSQPSVEPEVFHGEFDDKHGGAYISAPSTRDLPGAINAYGRACALGSPDGCLSRGVLEKLGGNLDAAEEHFQQAFAGWTAGCERGVGQHCQSMAAAFWGNWGHVANATKSYNLSVRACDLADGRGCWAQGRALLGDEIVPKDVDRAENLLRQSCDKLHTVVACLALRDLYAPAGVLANPGKWARASGRACALDPVYCESP